MEEFKNVHKNETKLTKLSVYSEWGLKTPKKCSKLLKQILTL